jgi:hypothetical protein
MRWAGHAARTGAYKILVGKFRVHYLQDLSVDGRILLKWIFENRCEDVDWIHLTRVRAFVNMVMNPQVP